jgi:hypothetical protein
MDKLCQNCKHHAIEEAAKHKNLVPADCDWASVCRLKAIFVSPWNHCPKFESKATTAQLEFSYDANGSPVEE